METTNAGSNNKVQDIQAYFSHSYRADDKKVNLFFWELFSKENFYFAVDPKSGKLVIPHLEMMMRNSDCFIAIITRRLEMIDAIGKISLPNHETHWTHSPYIAFENYLAELTSKPRLIFIERGLDPHLFGTPDCVHIFERTTLSQKGSEYREVVHNFARKVRDNIRSYESQILKPTAKAGFVIDMNNDYGYSPQIISNIQSALTSIGGYATEIISPNFDSTKSFARRLSDFDLLLMDVRPPFMPLDTLGFILAKGIPSIRIAKLLPGETAAQFVLPGLLKDFQIKGEEPPIITWVDQEELISKICQCLSKILQTNYWIDSFEQGYKYFSSAVRHGFNSQVFVSNPNSLNTLALDVIKGFQTANIPFFQYQFSIQTGTEWRSVMERELKKSDILVALINDDYHNSEWCQYELKVAYDGWEKRTTAIFPYIIEETRLPDLIRHAIQCADRRKWKNKEIVQDVVATIEKYLAGKYEV